MANESRTPGGRKIRSMLPLFPGYMFLHGDDYQRVEAMQGDHLANILEVANQAALEQDLRQIHQMLSSGLPIAPEPTHVVGATIRTLVGPLRGSSARSSGAAAGTASWPPFDSSGGG